MPPLLQTIRWLALCLVAATLAAVPPPALDQAAALEAAGDFTRARTLLAHAAQAPGLAETERRTLAWAGQRLHRIQLDYSHTRESLFTTLGSALRHLTRTEFDRWVEDGRFDARWIDGELRFTGTSVSNLFFRHPELNPRRVKPVNPPALQRSILADTRTIRASARQTGTPYADPRRFEISMTATLKPAIATAGDRIRCWLPIPRLLPSQDRLEWLDSSPPGASLAPDSSPIRSAYLEQPAAPDGSAVFRIRYAYLSRGMHHDLHPAQSIPCNPSSPELAPFLAEAPHVTFTAPARQLAASIAGRERNPVRQAKRYYEWIARHIRYSFAREYATIPDLGAYCRDMRYGDCGQEAFLFITLCRLSGIPARWQSGWSLFPGAETIHDWCEVYLAPWGWVPVDPYMGIYATQYAPALSASERRELRDFYFGGLDPFRLIANSDHSRELTPAKTDFRSDPVDFQRGELEAAGRNVYFDGFSYDLKWRPLPVEPDWP